MINNLRVSVLVPMKGNSERVPNKNIKLFNGKPLFCRIIDTLKESKYIDEIIVNTDSKVLKDKIFNFYNDSVIIHERPNHLIGDLVPMNEIISYDLDNSNSDIYIQTHSTNPLLLKDSIDAALESYSTFTSSGTDSIFSVTRLQTRLYDQDKKAINHNPNELVRTQDLPPVYEENSCFYIFSKDSFKDAGGKRIGNSPNLHEINKIEAVDIDDPEDFIIAESLHKLLR